MRKCNEPRPPATPLPPTLHVRSPPPLPLPLSSPCPPSTVFHSSLFMSPQLLSSSPPLSFSHHLPHTLLCPSSRPCIAATKRTYAGMLIVVLTWVSTPFGILLSNFCFMHSLPSPPLPSPSRPCPSTPPRPPPTCRRPASALAMPQPHPAAPAPLPAHPPPPRVQAAAPDGSWACSECGNVNYPFRSHCNRRHCGRPRPTHDTAAAVKQE
ncbi:unnamed protein product [Closterium sp. NIES-53]